jgi:hypothetical protein
MGNYKFLGSISEQATVQSEGDTEAIPKSILERTIDQQVPK